MRANAAQPDIQTSAQAAIQASTPTVRLPPAMRSKTRRIARQTIAASTITAAGCQPR